MGRSEQTRRNYRNDLQLLKLFLLLRNPGRARDEWGGPVQLDVEGLRQALAQSGGKLLDRLPARGRAASQGEGPRQLLERVDLSLAEITREELVAFFAHMEHELGLSRNSLARRLVSLRRFFRMLEKEGLPVQPGVVDKLETMGFRHRRRLPVTLDEDEVRAFLEVVDSPRDRAILYVMLFMGLRISEVVALNVDDIREGDEGLIIKGKGDKQRYVPIHPQVHKAVAAYRQHRPDQVIPDRWGVPLFVSRLRRRLDASTVRRFIKQYGMKAEKLKAQKARQLSPHKFRHTFATLLLQGQVDIRYIQELLGHEHLSTTQIYTRVARSDLEAAIARHKLSDL